ncbi:muramidase [Ligilactobacillus salitolerans]|uniref:Peptidoglycan hydrolase n=1 Tax=Ligilactobacillus salitolerans TaxID=1808352 RepID=A0A401ISL7_9LACO|nr:LysM peptidoglycan-binding domain-containing protein [Ligilactobacillus salitolerans]GBG94516.1 muramidase [Ligilactobacillus salitolerans]
MKKRKERIEAEKALQFTENFKSVKKATTYLGTTVLMGTAGVGLSRTKALADTTVQVADGQQTGAKNAGSQGQANGSSNQQGQGTVAAQNSQSTPQTTSGQASSSSEQTASQAKQQVETNGVNQQNTANKSLATNSVSTYSTRSLFTSTQGFINNIAPSAMQVAQQRGLYASLMIAQAALESGWGSSSLATSAHNLFGVKWSGSGAFVSMQTSEYYGGKSHTVQANFQKYSSYTDSLNNYANLILGHFPNSTLKAGSVEKAAANLAHGVYGTYATAPDYADKLVRLVNQYNLKQYDSKQSSTVGSSTPIIDQTSTKTNQSGAVAANGQYTVKSGDSLYRIAINHGMTLPELKSANNLTGNDIYPGQKLKVKQSGTTSSTSSKPAAGQAQKTTTSAQKPANAQTYRVQKHDSLWSISQKFKTKVDQLRAWNNLQGDIIYVNQELVVGQKAAQTTPVKTQKVNQNQPAATQQNKQTTAGSSYTVKSSDSLWAIAHQHNMTVAQIKKLNNLTSDLITVGQKLQLSGPQKSQTTSTAQKKTAAPEPNDSSSTYQVKSGDSLWSIATQHGMTVPALKAANHLTSDLITVGQKLQVRGKSAAKTSTQTKQASAKKTSSSKQIAGTYVVQKNDSLWSIANEHHTTIAKLRELNHLTGSVIYIGQSLRVQQRSSVNAATKTVQSQDAKQGSYVVAQGDSLWRIATRNKLTVNQLKSLNHLVSDTIYVGQTLKLK